MTDKVGIQIISDDRRGILMEMTEVIYKHGGNLSYTHSFTLEQGGNIDKVLLYFEVREVEKFDDMMEDLRGLSFVHEATIHPMLDKVYGSRIIIIGGGAQVTQVAMGAISEADRHNIRGERISVDTIPLIGEEDISEAVKAVGRLHRASILILAGGIMGGQISREVERLSKSGIPVIALKMAGSVVDYADLVVTDPIQAGTFAAMHVARTAVFDIERVKGKTF